MTEYTKHIALFFLSVFVLYLAADGAMKGVKLYYSASPDRHIVCKKKQLLANTNPSVSDLLVNADQPSENEANLILINCSTSLNILPNNSQSLLNSDRVDYIIGIKPSLLASQIFVFQEPDPPRLV